MLKVAARKRICDTWWVQF